MVLLIKNQISLLLKDRQNLLIQSSENLANAHPSSNPETNSRFEKIQQQQQHYKHTDIPVNLMEESVAAFAPGKYSRGNSLPGLLLSQFSSRWIARKYGRVWFQHVLLPRVSNNDESSCIRVNGSRGPPWPATKYCSVSSEFDSFGAQFSATICASLNAASCND